MVNILFLVANFPPEISTGRLEHELSKSLAMAGHSVTVVTAFPRKYLVSQPTYYNTKRPFYREKIDNINVIRVGPEFSNRDNVFMRGVEYFFEFFSFFFGGLISSSRSDIIFCSSPPLTLAFAGHFLSKIKRAPIVVRIGDLHPDELVDMGLVNNKLVVRLLEFIERFVYRKTDFFTVLSPGYRKHLLRKGAKSNKVYVLQSWGNTEEIEQLSLSKQNSNLSDKFTVIYAGSMSWFQDLETMIDAAALLKEYPDIHFLLVGDGAQKKFLLEKSKLLKLSNVTFMPLQSREKYLKLLWSSSVCVVSIKKEVKTTTLPSKLLDIMACSRPVIANVPFGEISELIFNSQGGIWVDAQNPKRFAEAVLQLYQNPKLSLQMGLNARNYVDKNFTLQSATKKYESIICQLIEPKKYKMLQ